MEWWILFYRYFIQIISLLFSINEWLFREDDEEKDLLRSIKKRLSNIFFSVQNKHYSFTKKKKRRIFSFSFYYGEAGNHWICNNHKYSIELKWKKKTNVFFFPKDWYFVLDCKDESYSWRSSRNFYSSYISC
jgi:hypothetical protein